MLLNTFEDVLQIFGVICSGSIQPLSCGIWLTHENYTQKLKEKIFYFIQDYKDSILFYRSGFHQSEVMFKNGSIIRFIIANENQRGFRFHFSAYDQNIELDLINSIIIPKSYIGFPPKPIQIN